MTWNIFSKKFWLNADPDEDPVYDRFAECPCCTCEEEDDDFVSVEDLVDEVEDLMAQANELVDEAEAIKDEIIERTDELDEPDQIDTVEDQYGVVYLRIWYPLHTEF